MPRFSSRSSSVSAYDDIDAITPCPLPVATTTTSPSTNPATSSSYTTPTKQQEDEAEQGGQSRRSTSSSNYHHHHHHHHQGISTTTTTANNQRSPSPTHSSSSTTSSSAPPSEADLHDIWASRHRDSVRALERGTGGDPERLWRRMLALQQVYGCYNSARMSAALESGDASLLLRPSRACLNLLNDHMVLLPDDADYFLFKDNTTTPTTTTCSEHPTNR